MAITAHQVKELRDRTGLGMMECKAVLTETKGDMEAAIELLRKRAGAKVEKKSGRLAAEGIIGVHVSPDLKTAAMVEINSETDFVAKGDDLADFGATASAVVANMDPTNVDELYKLPQVGSSATLAQTREGLVMKLGENISIRRFVRITSDKSYIGSYVHGRKIGVLIEVKGGDESLAKDLAMHVAASRPEYVSKEQVPVAIVSKEKEIFFEQAKSSGKPPEIVEKMIMGRVDKYLNEITLLGQPFVKDTEMTVAKLLKSKGASVIRFIRYEVGEGMEKKSSDFASEVMAQVKGG